VPPRDALKPAFHHLQRLRHPDRAIRLDRLAEERARLVAVAVGAASDQHRRIPASHVWLGDLVGHLVRLAKRRLEMCLGRVTSVESLQ